MRLFAIALTLVSALTSHAAARTNRRTCLHACADELAACTAAGGSPRRCRKIILRGCRTAGVNICQGAPATTQSPTTTTASLFPTTTTTTLAIDRTVHGCNRQVAMDLRGSSSVTVGTESFDYAPECVRVSPGTPVTFRADFRAFPLVGGERPTPDPASPFGRIDSGSSSTVTIFEPGVYGYFADPWWIFKMYGAVIVDP
jgi:plastocyanin